jgi:hypothetical protein
MSLTALELFRCPHFGNIASPGAVLRRSLDEERRDASGERGTAEMKLAGASLIKGPMAFVTASVYAKTLPTRPLERAMNSMPAHR